MMAVAALMWAAGFTARADVIAALSTPTGTSFRSDGTAQVGWMFTAAVDAPSISELGIWVAPEGTVSTHGKTATGVLMYDHKIALYNSSKTVIALANISAGAVPDANRYAWVSLGTPVSLTAGQAYYVMTDMPGSTPNNDIWTPWSGSAGVTMSSSFGTFDGSVYSGSTMPSAVGQTSSLSNPDPGNNGYIGPNIGYVIPEPASLSLFGAAALAAWAARRRRV
jgi:hypothetical protein